ncbi:MAG: DUF3570 domain-containing protein [Myxococcales bacterium]|nr:DUF3570 domain-containing protein [Myxococcales bacterium]
MTPTTSTVRRTRVARHRSPHLLALLACSLACLWGPLPDVAAQEVALANYIRTDSDQTTVIAPRLRVNYPIVEGTTVDAVYAVDIWTSASIDIRTSATKVPVTEQRDEFDLSVAHTIGDGVLSAAYRNSSEPDYQSHGVSLSLSQDFASRNTTLAVGLSVGRDTVGRVDWDQWKRGLTTIGGRVALTQVVDVDTLVMLMYEPQYVDGYQASAYRRVAIGGNLGNCWGPPQPSAANPDEPAAPLDPAIAAAIRAPLCPEEANPEQRLRHAIAGRGRRALGEHLSVGAAYRLYLDDWGILSHTIEADLVYSFVEGTYVAVGYRFYTQGSADHYKPIYWQPEPFMTSDKELSSLSAHRASIEFEHAFSGGLSDPGLRVNLSVAPSIYFYPEFPLLDQIEAVDVNGAVVWAF